MATNDEKPRIRVLVVDDHPLVCQGIAGMIDQQEDMTACGQASDKEEGLKAVRLLNPDVVMVDLSLKHSSGFDLIGELKSQFPELPCLVVSMHEETIYAERALRLGARGYVMKTDNPHRIIEGIRCVAGGKIFVSEEISERAAEKQGDKRGKKESPIDLLTEREAEIFRMIAQGKNSREIAAQLGLSVKTVDVHRQHIKAKLSVRNSTELVKKAVEYMGAPLQSLS